MLELLELLLEQLLDLLLKMLLELLLLLLLPLLLPTARLRRAIARFNRKYDVLGDKSRRHEVLLTFISTLPHLPSQKTGYRSNCKTKVQIKESRENTGYRTVFQEANGHRRGSHQTRLGSSGHVVLLVSDW